MGVAAAELIQARVERAGEETLPVREDIEGDVMAGGNENVILCERGIRTFESYTRNTLDLACIPVLRKLTHLPIIIDPSHATGKSWLVDPLAMGAVATGADGLLIEVHNDPAHAKCDGQQSLTPKKFDELMKKIAVEGTLQHIDEIPDDIKRVFVCSHDVSPLYHVKMQAAFQKHTDNAVSKTVNFAHGATMEDVEEVYMLAYELDCKGVTIYRDGSRAEQVLNIGSVKKEGETEAPPAMRTDIRPRPRPEVTCGLTERMKIGCGNLYVTVNLSLIHI